MATGKKTPLLTREGHEYLLEAAGAHVTIQNPLSWSEDSVRRDHLDPRRSELVVFGKAVPALVECRDVHLGTGTFSTPPTPSWRTKYTRAAPPLTSNSKSSSRFAVFQDQK